MENLNYGAKLANLAKIRSEAQKVLTKKSRFDLKTAASVRDILEKALEQHWDLVSIHPGDAVSASKHETEVLLEEAREIENKLFDQHLRANDPGVKFVENLNRLR